MKYNSNGSLQYNKVFSKSDSGAPIDVKYYISGQITQYDDTHVIISGGVLYVQSSLGIAINSMIDQLVFKMDFDLNIKWASLFDFQYNFDTESNSLIYEGLIYTASYVGSWYPCFFSINGTDGHYTAAKVYTQTTYSNSISSAGNI